MSVQVGVIEKPGSKPAGVVVRAEKVVGDGFDSKKFVENFDVLATASGGIERLRAMTLSLAIRGALTSEQRGGACAPVAEGLNPPFNVPPGWAWRLSFPGFPGHPARRVSSGVLHGSESKSETKEARGRVQA
jgi:hypothetical protein